MDTEVKPEAQAPPNGHGAVIPQSAVPNPMKMHRRAFQKAAVDTMNRQAAAIIELQTFVTDLLNEAALNKQHREFVADLSVRVDCLTIWQRRGFLGRVKWVLLGR